MKLKKILVVAASLCIISGVLAGCGSKKEESSKENSEKVVTVGKVSTENPIYVDKENKSVTILGKVNGKYFEEPTRHFMVYEGGKNGDKSIITGIGNHLTFYKDLMEIGAKPGNNMTAENKMTTHVKGDDLNVTVTWNGADRQYDINDIVKDSNGKKILMKFGGNQKAAEKMDTGCIACLDSCPVGIVSNPVYTYGAVEKRNEVKFTGNKDVLPKDGTYVAVTFKLVPAEEQKK